MSCDLHRIMESPSSIVVTDQQGSSFWSICHSEAFIGPYVIMVYVYEIIWVHDTSMTCEREVIKEAGTYLQAAWAVPSKESMCRQASLGKELHPGIKPDLGQHLPGSQLTSKPTPAQSSNRLSRLSLYVLWLVPRCHSCRASLKSRNLAESPSQLKAWHQTQLWKSAAAVKKWNMQLVQTTFCHGGQGALSLVAKLFCLVTNTAWHCNVIFTERNKQAS